MIGLLDGDIVVFRCGFACERNIWHLAWAPVDDEFTKNQTFEYKKEAMEHLDKVVPGQFSREEGKDFSLWPVKDLQPIENAFHSTKTLVQRVADACALDPKFDMKVFFSSSKNFRHDVAVTRPYKGNRKSEHRPTYENEIRNYLKENYDCETGDHVEADDLLGIAQTQYGPEESVIISLDKDLDQVPGLKYNWMHDVHYNVTPEQAYYNFHIQLMSGDSTDNIPGLPSVGPAKAAKALHGLDTQQDQFDEVCRMYQLHSGMEDWYEYLIEQARLLWIQREQGQDVKDLLDPMYQQEDVPTELTLELS